MGGAESLLTGLNHLDQFAWVGAFSSGGLPEQFETKFPNLDAKANQQLHLLWIACGTDDGLIKLNRQFREWLKTKPPKEEVEKYQFVPHVVEPSAGADRFTLAVLCEAYAEDEVGGEARTVMRFHPRLAPIKAAVFPLVKKDGMPEKAQALYRELKKHFKVEYDDAGAVGRRYRRQDEIGTPYCITVDFETLDDNAVTVRDRDSMTQDRVSLDRLVAHLSEQLPT